MATNSSSAVTVVLNSTLEAVQTVIPLEFVRDAPEFLPPPLMVTEMGVLVGVTGDIRGRIIIESSIDVFKRIGERLFGMALDGPMLESMVGEIGNQIGGNMCTNVSALGSTLDISPPTVMTGQTRLGGFSKGLVIPIQIPGIGKIRVILVIEDT